MKYKDVRNTAHKATRSDYEAWLLAFFACGGVPTHYYDYPWERADNWYKVKKHTACDIPALYGANSISIRKK